MTGVVFDPLIGWPFIWAIAALSAAVIGLSLWRGLRGWWLRGFAAVALLVALANPALQRENREALSDIVIAVIDDSASQSVSDRPSQTADALANLRREVAGFANTELREITVPDGTGDTGTRAMTALTEALAEEPSGRIAGVVLLSDGRIHDMDRMPTVPAPVHLLQSGKATDWDRRLIVRNAPAFAIIGEAVSLTLRIEDQGNAPTNGGLAPLTIAIDGGVPMRFDVPLGQDIDLPITLPHGGMNVLQFATTADPTELTDRNNAAVVQINGVRDRLRVLLVSGEPHAGERTWRNLLKSDRAVDLVHFTILRPPEKQDGVPVDELSLIAFPTRELFLEKINDFDLIIFDRYRRRGILPNAYYENIANYVEQGGALLVSSGPEFGTADSIYRSALGDVIPGAPTARVIEEGFVPTVSDLGQRHPVTEGLEDYTDRREDGSAGWGRWFRLMDVVPTPDAEVVMTGPDDRPLLVLNRVGDGRVALLTSDQSWLWDRGVEGGGPQLELLRRLAHWMMKEPELEEEALWAEVTGQSIRIIRRTLGDTVGSATVIAPDGTEVQMVLTQTAPGRFETSFDAIDMGLYRIREGDQETVIAAGPAAPKEFEETIATNTVIAPLIEATGGGTLRMEDGTFDVRPVRAGRVAAGNGWIGITPRGAYRTAEVAVFPLVPAWLFLILAAALILAAWLREGRR
ncbi:hypothetical protein [Marivivens donghaensis]|uniref:hypothetical protein n=1 Tax=Marivivens donghaensis TaxID=1699413 RepID=UPI00201EAE4D|nr:hypothetical protein [Marivivens donghaensis]MCL7408310.1 hypothetical protein [Marivivens donghaensis]MDN3704919.1 hypothetical protein [Marivivens donghaensis]